MICWGFDRIYGLFDVYVFINGLIGYYYNYIIFLIIG